MNRCKSFWSDEVFATVRRIVTLKSLRTASNILLMSVGFLGVVFGMAFCTNCVVMGKSISTCTIPLLFAVAFFFMLWYGIWRETC